LLNPWGDHLGYLRTGCDDHTHRVVRLGVAVVPVVFPYDAGGQGTTEQCITIIHDALKRLAAEVGPTETDPITRIVYAVLTGELAPLKAVQEIHALSSAFTMSVREPVREEVER
jgi:hypothetical protein